MYFKNKGFPVKNKFGNISYTIVHVKYSHIWTKALVSILWNWCEIM